MLYKSVFSFDSGFLGSLVGLPKEIKAKLPKCLDQLARDRRHTGLRVEPLAGRAAGLFSARVDLDYRLIFAEQVEGEIRLLSVGPHDRVYRDAERTRFERPREPEPSGSLHTTAELASLAKAVGSEGGKYLPLSKHLLEQAFTATRIRLAFSEIEALIGDLPPTALKNPTWWANNAQGHTQAAAWLAVGWRTGLASAGLRSRTMTFFRMSVDEPVKPVLPGGTITETSAGPISLDPVPPPLRIDPYGVCRVSDTRVTLESVLALFQQGASPEEISQAFPSVSLADAYATIAFYLRNRDRVNRYLETAELRETDARKQIRSRFPMTEIRERLLARRKPVSV